MAASQDTIPRTILSVERLSKSFGRRVICREASFSLTAGDTLAIVGPNGSGKSTVVKVLTGLLRADAGTITFSPDGHPAKPEEWYKSVGLVSPELALYEELTGYENLEFGNAVGDWGKNRQDFDRALEEFGLGGRGDDFVRTYSSGMKQRLKFAAAFAKDPALLFLDEPTSNLDEEGCARVWRALESRSAAVVIATNVPDEAARCRRQFTVGPDGGLNGDA